MKHRKSQRSNHDSRSRSRRVLYHAVKGGTGTIRSWLRFIGISVLFLFIWIYSSSNLAFDRRVRSEIEQQGPPFTGAKNIKETRVLPWRCRLPKVTQLFQTDKPYILRRHQCLVKIREQQLAAFMPYLQRNYSEQSAHEMLLVDPAYHGNVGDHMITVAEHELFRQFGWDVSLDGRTDQSYYRECHYVQANNFVRHCEDMIWEGDGGNRTKIAVWHGGGNWGDLWRVVQSLRIQSLRPLVHNRFRTIISMPQSLYYGHKETEEYDARVIERELRVGATSANESSEGILVLSWREYESYKKAQKLYPFARNIFVPDISFQLGPYALAKENSSEISDQVDYLFLLRRDHESSLVPQMQGLDDDNVASPNADTVLNSISVAVKDAVKDIAPTKSFRVLDWPDRFEIFGSKNEPFFSETSIQLLSLGKVVICDRLHAAILAFLMGAPFVFLDQSTGKISKSLEVAFDSWEGCHENLSLKYAYARSLTDAIERAQELLH